MQDYLSSAIVLIALFVSFIALVIWAWSKHHNATFKAASNLPLEDDDAVIASQDHESSSADSINQDKA